MQKVGRSLDSASSAKSYIGGIYGAIEYNEPMQHASGTRNIQTLPGEGSQVYEFSYWDC